MEEEQNNNPTGMLEKGASAAGAVRGAAKTGKAIANASRGAAVAGPYGAAAGALWSGHRYLGRIAIVLAALFLLPVMIITMLPGLIFGGYSDSFSPSDPDQPILNSESAILSNANEITFTVSAVLGEAMDETERRIAEEFALTDGDCMEIVNPYEASPAYNANLFISQYCAYKNDDFAGISLAGLEQALRDNMEYLYSYTWKEEYRERPMTEEEMAEMEAQDPPEETTEEENPETEAQDPPEETTGAEGPETEPSDAPTGESTGEAEPEEIPTVTEKWYVYTLVYNGESYFAEQVFALNDGQKKLANDYAYNLSLFLGDGLLQNLPAWEGNSIASLGSVSFTDGATEVVYYNQLDERYAGEPYGTDPIGGYGCGPTAMAIVVSSLAGETVDPVEMASWAYENGYWCKSSGSYHALIPAAAQEWDLPVSGCTASEPQRILDALAGGKLVVAIMGKGHFTSSGHFIVLRGVQDGQILVADPASYTRSGQPWDLSIILSEASKHAGSGGPFWIIG